VGIVRHIGGNFKARAISFRDVTAFIVRNEWALTLSVTSALLGFLPLINPPSIVLPLIGVTGGVATIVLLAKDLRHAFDRHADWEFCESLPAISRSQGILDRHLQTTVWMSRGTMVTSAALNRQLASWDAPVDWRAEDFKLNGELADWAPAVVLRSTRGRFPYNRACVRLETDLDEQAAQDRLPLAMRRARYFDGLASNMLAPWTIKRNGIPLRFQDKYLLVDGAADSQHILLPLSNNALANIVGVSTLAITSDDCLIMPLQSGASASSPYLLAPSGSGSLEFKDIDKNSAASTVIKGAERELMEECGLIQAHIAGTALIGFGRWLEHGAKPEFNAVTALNICAADIRRRPRWSDMSESVWTRSISIKPITCLNYDGDAYSYEGSMAALITDGESLNGSASMPLEFGARSLVDALAHQPDILTRLRSSQREET
jgi:hypothetical protein